MSTGRKNTPREAIYEAIFNSPEGALTARDLNELGMSVVPARLNRMVTEGFLALRASTQPVLDEAGNPQRGRPRHLYGLSKNVRARYRRQASKATA
jgi:hypothetical protein